MTENREAAKEVFKIPTREEHRRTVRRIWTSCICIGLSVMSSMAGMVAIMMFKDFSHQLIVSCSTVLFQIIIGGVFTGFTTPYFLETRVNINVGMEMNRKALELGTQTADNLEKLERRIEPVVGRVEGLLGKAEKLMDSAEHDGPSKFDRLLTALEKIAARTSEKADEQLEELLRESGFGEATAPGPVDSQPPPS